MSGVSVIRYRIANTAGVTALVSSSRIMAGPLPEGTSLPAISVSEISAVPDVGTLWIDRVQVTVFARSYVEMRAVMAAVEAVTYPRGTINGFNVDSVHDDAYGPDGFDDVLLAHFKPRDYRVLWNK